MANAQFTHDPLYGSMTFSSQLYELIGSPIVQRLRGIRLSNIDSVAMPGLAGVTRFEHSLGTLYVTSRTRASTALSEADRLVLQAAALLHDSLIPALGHLVEEALAYDDATLDHETYWDTLLSRTELTEVGGAELQIYLGQQSGLEKWAQRHLGPSSDQRLKDLVLAVRGEGPWGKCISGPMDVDNLDNVARVAFHLGLPFDRALPLTIASAATGVDRNGFIFDDSALHHITEWTKLRANVYEHLMPAEPDFAGKIMIISAILEAYREGIFQKPHWKLTDSDLITRFTACGVPAVEVPIRRWLLGDPWNTSNLTWMEGKVPPYVSVRKYSELISKLLGRQCIAYRIKDKRHRSLSIRTTSGKVVTLGSTSALWLLGVASPLRRSFTARENSVIVDAAKDFFGCTVDGVQPRAPDAVLQLF